MADCCGARLEVGSPRYRNAPPSARASTPATDAKITKRFAGRFRGAEAPRISRAVRGESGGGAGRDGADGAGSRAGGCVAGGVGDDLGGSAVGLDFGAAAISGAGMAGAGASAAGSCRISGEAAGRSFRSEAAGTSWGVNENSSAGFSASGWVMGFDAGSGVPLAFVWPVVATISPGGSVGSSVMAGVFPGVAAEEDLSFSWLARCRASRSRLMVSGWLRWRPQGVPRTEGGPRGLPAESSAFPGNRRSGWHRSGRWGAGIRPIPTSGSGCSCT